MPWAGFTLSLDTLSFFSYSIAVARTLQDRDDTGTCVLYYTDTEGVDMSVNVFNVNVSHEFYCLKQYISVFSSLLHNLEVENSVKQFKYYCFWIIAI